MATGVARMIIWGARVQSCLVAVTESVSFYVRNIGRKLLKGHSACCFCQCNICSSSFGWSLAPLLCSASDPILLFTW
eukprot:1153297-Pelagomonas_calceolata.AAC.6